MRPEDHHHHAQVRNSQAAEDRRPHKQVRTRQAAPPLHAVVVNDILSLFGTTRVYSNASNLFYFAVSYLLAGGASRRRASS